MADRRTVRVIIEGKPKKKVLCPLCGKRMVEQPFGCHLGKGFWILAFDCVKCEGRRGR